jgi:hypothetical protein
MDTERTQLESGSRAVFEVLLRRAQRTQDWGVVAQVIEMLTDTRRHLPGRQTVRCGLDEVFVVKEMLDGRVYTTPYHIESECIHPTLEDAERIAKTRPNFTAMTLLAFILEMMDFYSKELRAQERLGYI